MPAALCQPAQRAWAQPRGAAAGRCRRAAAPPQAFFQSLFKRAEAAPTAGGLVEKPLYKPSEMVQMGPFKASPMGYGTWAW